MRFGIRFKFIVILIVAAVLPLLLGLISVGFLGYRHYKIQRGELFTTTALYISKSLGGITREQIHNVIDWIELTDTAGLIQSIETNYPPSAPATDRDGINRIEEFWPTIDEQDSLLGWILNNEAADRLRLFQSVNPLYVEMFITDRTGRLLAASNKTTDYMQADESWWQNAVSIGHDEIWVEGINFDESAGVFSLDVAKAIRTNDEKRDLLGVIKGVVNVSPLLRSIQSAPTDEHPDIHVVMNDARILVRLFGESPTPLQEKFSDAIFRGLNGSRAGWTVNSLDGTNMEMIGYAPLSMELNTNGDIKVEGLKPMYVFAHDTIDHIMRPVYRMSFILGSIGLVVVLCFGVIGLYIADRKIIAPLEILKNAARSISASARLTGIQNAPVTTIPAESMLQKVDQINTGDEIESLSGDFSLMARRVMNYHVQLEDELARKTEAIQEDLVMAREFQESMLPSEYPKVSDWNARCNLALEFYHVYKPTLSVGGDFFHVEKINDHSASIFIADVTGHGARAALVTAILRTLCRDLSARADNPTEFMKQMNHQFYSIMPRHLDCIFATGLYLVIDLEKHTARLASAGHPFALLIDRNNCCVSPMLQSSDCGPALGLMETAAYRTIERPIHDRDAFLLFTDGLIEAANPRGEEFGWERLMSVTSRNYQQPISRHIMQLLDEASRFMDTEMALDDICVVAIEAHEIKKETPPTTSRT